MKKQYTFFEWVHPFNFGEHTKLETSSTNEMEVFTANQFAVGLKRLVEVETSLAAMKSTNEELKSMMKSTNEDIRSMKLFFISCLLSFVLFSTALKLILCNLF
ncbi:hypothetical protein QJS10_CPA08g00531 [Acorus calamus]|uniref:Uncharacterized protein n=1 Tax=Acorus calamus TaxID=4465 RepID=A0AAV9E9J6_ACOCL|nr:hypothetical protein QJS10_CPA08g00531 [Acorus calamus]